jgi:hypothetical protein
MAADDDVAELLGHLDRAVVQLREQGHADWADWLALDRTRFAGGDPYGLGHLVSAFGGMGSLSDQVVSDDLPATLSQIYDAATRLPREVD